MFQKFVGFDPETVQGVATMVELVTFLFQNEIGHKLDLRSTTQFPLDSQHLGIPHHGDIARWEVVERLDPLT
jgi:hypothetical protein